jgi:hypothetical protein
VLAEGDEHVCQHCGWTEEPSDLDVFIDRLVDAIEWPWYRCLIVPRPTSPRVTTE